jgi:hypothetical protein
MMIGYRMLQTIPNTGAGGAHVGLVSSAYQFIGISSLN